MASTSLFFVSIQMSVDYSLKKWQAGNAIDALSDCCPTHLIIILFKDYKVNANYLNSDIKAVKYPCLLCFFVLSMLR